MFNGCLDGVDSSEMDILNSRVYEFIQDKLKEAAKADISDKVRHYRNVADYYMLYQALNVYMHKRETARMNLDRPIADIVAELWESGGL